MSIQTKAINVTSFAIVLASAFAGSKYTESIFLTKTNHDYIQKINSMSLKAKLHWNQTEEALKAQITQLADSIKVIEESEDKRVQNKLDNERKLLHESYTNAIQQKKNELDTEMQNFQETTQKRLNSAVESLSKVETQLEAYFTEYDKHKELERISQLIIEDKIDGQFSNCFSLKTLREEFKHLITIVRQYHMLNQSNMTLFKYVTSKLIANVMFDGAPVKNYDIFHELGLAIENGDLHRSLFLFNNLKGWPRLILKDWAEKCRKRMEFVQEIKHQLYLNKI